MQHCIHDITVEEETGEFENGMKEAVVCEVVGEEREKR